MFPHLMHRRTRRRHMDSLPLELLSHVLQNLTTTEKWLVRGVSVKWMTVVSDLLSLQSKIGIVDHKLTFSHSCLVSHPDHYISQSDVLVNYADRLPLHVLHYFKSLTVVRIKSQCEVDAEQAIGIIVDTNHRTLRCISCTGNFFQTKCMPRLMHLKTRIVSLTASENLINSSPGIQAIECAKFSSTMFARLPHGLTSLSLDSEHANLQSIFKSAAADSLSVLCFRVTLGLMACSVFRLPNLTRLRIRGSADGPTFVSSLLKSLRHSPHLLDLDLYSMIHTGTQVSEWMDFFPFVPKLQLIKLSFTVVTDDFIQALVNSCPDVREVTFTDSRLTDRSLDLFAGLTSLQDLDLESWKNDFTEAGVFRLIEGSSRSSLIHLSINSRNDVQSERLLAEIAFMKNHESGCRLKSVFFHSQ